MPNFIANLTNHTNNVILSYCPFCLVTCLFSSRVVKHGRICFPTLPMGCSNHISGDLLHGRQLAQVEIEDYIYSSVEKLLLGFAQCFNDLYPRHEALIVITFKFGNTLPNFRYLIGSSCFWVRTVHCHNNKCVMFSPNMCNG